MRSTTCNRMDVVVGMLISGWMAAAYVAGTAWR